MSAEAPGDAPVIVACAFDPFDARLLAALLTSHGLSPVAVWHETLSNDWAMMLACGGVRISVPAAEVEHAVAALKDLPAAAPFRVRWRLMAVWALLSVLLVAPGPLPLRLRAELPRRISVLR